MKGVQGLLATVVALAMSNNWALAEEGDDGDEDGLFLTITMIPEDVELPGVVTGEITLPEEAAVEAGENSADGLERANQARADGHAMGEAAAEDARGNREDLGGGSLPNLDDLIPDSVPGVPHDLPAVPEDRPGEGEIPDVPAMPEAPDVPGGNAP